MGNVLSMLQAPGDLKNGTQRDELRGRAKDEKQNVDGDYSKINIKTVVRLDKRTATSKDLEMANREIALDYRDEEGRELTRKEAFRQLCYQFHGYGSGKKNQEKRMKRHTEENSDTKVTKQKLSGMEALKKSQKKSGKAHVVLG
jgi:U4/U6.U5 tri-snRNP-associated protein 1